MPTVLFPLQKGTGRSSWGRPVLQPLSHGGGSWPGGNSIVFYFFASSAKSTTSCPPLRATWISFDEA